MNRPIVNWSARTQPLFDASPTQPFGVSADILERQAEMLAAHVEARIKAEHDLATLTFVANDIMKCSVQQDAELKALETKQKLMVAAAKELIEQLMAEGLKGRALKLVCNFNRAVSQR